MANKKNTNTKNETVEEVETKKTTPEKIVIGKKTVKILAMLRGNYGAYDPDEIVTIDSRLAENFVKAHAAEYVE